MAETWRQMLTYYLTRVPPASNDTAIVLAPELIVRYDIEPVPAPRMTRFDGIRIAELNAGKRVKIRPGLLSYIRFKDAIGQAVLDSVQHDVFHLADLLHHVGLRFYLPMAPSWSKKKRQEHLGQPHLLKPDNDNLVKAFYDALFEHDSRAWDVHAQKRWEDAAGPRIEIWRLPSWDV